VLTEGLVIGEYQGQATSKSGHWDFSNVIWLDVGSEVG
jgi:hypothetical protein